MSANRWRAGPGTERSVVNSCQPNVSGASRLESYFDPNDRKYFITPESAYRAIQDSAPTYSLALPGHFLRAHR